jgi:adenylate cyclase
VSGTPPAGEPRGASAAAWARQLRLVSGLILLTYVTTHFVNHALGLISLDAMEAGRHWFLTLWRNPVGTIALYGALVIHFALALWALFVRRHLRLPVWELVRLALGLSIPVLLVEHVVANRLAHSWLGTTDSYTRTVLTLWVLRPDRGAWQAVALVVVWLHGCMGVHYWLRIRPWYRRASPWLFALALLVPVLALLGFAQAGREVSRLATTPGWIEHVLRTTNTPDTIARAPLDRAETAILWTYWLAVGGVFAARALRSWHARRWHVVRITYPDGREVAVPEGYTILEASRRAGIAHASVCGGRGRCSTCRVRIGQGLEALPLPEPEELRVLRRVSVPPNVRLACQVRPTVSVAVTPLVSATVGPDAALTPVPEAGREQEVTVLFADLREFTTLAERKLPYDVVFFLNRYFQAVGSAVEQTGGLATQFTGDGVMALFGVDLPAREGCRRALRAADAMTRSVAELSRSFGDELRAPLRLGIGIHTGPAVVGRMGYRDAVHLAAVGDTVHVASRLQELTKQYGGPLVISQQVALRAGLDPSAYPRHELAVRNRREPLIILVVDELARAVAGLDGGRAGPDRTTPVA